MTAAEEDVLISGFYGDTPPCAVWKGEQRCGEPSTFRIIAGCTVCLRQSPPFFICRECHEDLRSGRITCPACSGRMQITRYL
jgi:hypothetical protein